MTPDPLTVTPETSVFAALHTLDSMRVSSLPVVGKHCLIVQNVTRDFVIIR